MKAGNTRPTQGGSLAVIFGIEVWKKGELTTPRVMVIGKSFVRRNLRKLRMRSIVHGHCRRIGKVSARPRRTGAVIRFLGPCPERSLSREKGPKETVLILNTVNISP